MAASGKTRCYSELIALPTFEQRFNYCNLNGVIGEDTFGFHRYLNQAVYQGTRWRRLRDKLIVRDDCCELAMPDHKIRGKVILHHLNPLEPEEIEELDECVYDEENLVCVSLMMHNAIHYGSFDLVRPFEEIERRPFDTAPWRNT